MFFLKLNCSSRILGCSFFVTQFFVRWAIGQKIKGQKMVLAPILLHDHFTKQVAVLLERLDDGDDVFAWNIQ